MAGRGGGAGIDLAPGEHHDAPGDRYPDVSEDLNALAPCLASLEVRSSPKTANPNEIVRGWAVVEAMSCSGSHAPPLRPE